MSVVIQPSSQETRDVQNTCNVLHIPRGSLLDSKAVLEQLIAFGSLVTSDPGPVTSPAPKPVNVAWLGDDSSDVISCVFGKDIDGVVGTVSLALKSTGVDYSTVVLPGDILFIYMDDGGNYDPSQLGYGTLITIVVVDLCSLSRTVENMATIEVTNISARDLAVVFTESSTVFDPTFAQIENALYTKDFLNSLLGKTVFAFSPLENVLVLLRLLYDSDFTKGSAGASLQWKMRADNNDESMQQLVSLLDVATYVQNPIPHYALIEPPGIVQAGNVWSLLESYCNPLVNEFFVDIRDETPQDKAFRQQQSSRALMYVTETDAASQLTAVNGILGSQLFKTDGVQINDGLVVKTNGLSAPALVFRERPYSDEDFNALPVTEVYSTEVESADLSQSSHDVLNWYRVRFPGIDVKMQEFVYGLQYVPHSVAKFGYRRMDSESRYMFLNSQGAVDFNTGGSTFDFSSIFKLYVDRFSDWYSQNEFWFSGSLTMRLKPSIRIGTRLRLIKIDRVLEFYVQGVQHMFHKDPGSSRTHLTLLRGRDINVSIPDPAISTFTHEGIVTLRAGSASSPPPGIPTIPDFLGG